MITITLASVPDWDALGALWRDLERRADHSFFQSWTWTGCLAMERFTDPVLATAMEAGRVVGLALFNRQFGLPRATLHLGETGMPAQDRLAIEHNGPLAERPDIALALQREAMRLGDVLIGGVVGAARGIILRSQPSPFVDLTLPIPFLDRRSANTRQQIRRSDRGFAVFGPLRLARADNEPEAHAWLNEMAALHQATWTRRGRDGSFADPFFGRFHHALIGRGLAGGEIDLLRVTAGERLIGILYNFRHRNRVMAYQTGFAFDADDARMKPGLTCHAMAINFYAQSGMLSYDFLAGDARYKQSLSDGRTLMHWMLIAPWWSPRALPQRLRGLGRALVNGMGKGL